ncbi:gamma carbonic anhydrase family protein [Methanobacterium sp. CWC-01]|uniref:gamma carbonic anhydrase family protein n=1 Tax=Methanobacterium aridiramus TaxID=2584467 RepID=UPI00257557AC|nr:gamma carbonic anhydrase family protein [Methanobacterium sp. CWC-01]WJI09917.1 gamma carbonic anhydrase family protein [Methanobacterium sp. CWC-01]
MIHRTVKLFSGAKIVGEVKIGQNSSVWYNAVIRGDMGSITIGESSNIQDNSVVHSPAKIGDFVTVGHSAVVHACTVEENCIIGINSTILDGAVIRKNSIVGASALVTAGKEFPEGSLILGVPARAVRQLGQEEISRIKDNALRYVELSREKNLTSKQGDSR